ncbi:MAG: hypothetical protein KKB13_19685 [Chloroflexi bacterium]|nr:hypothetical protein [Chloroflexota bacterium]MBU1878025.1 hypothetical protein [Chloroflexota bacterium]
MPLAGFICELDGWPRTYDECRACAAAPDSPGLATYRRRPGPKAQGGGKHVACHFTPPLLASIWEAVHRRDPAEAGISVTMLLGCPRKVALEQATDYYVAPSSLYWLWRGIIGHAGLEGAASDGAIVEQRFRRLVPGTDLVISGQPDIVYPAAGRLVDYKTTKRAPQPTPLCGQRGCGGYVVSRNGSKPRCNRCGHEYSAAQRPYLRQKAAQPYDHHAEQLNCYRWLLWGQGIRVRSLEVLYLDMSAPVRTFAPVWPLARTEAFVRERALRLQAALAGPLPPPLDPQDPAAWACPKPGYAGYCNVADACQTQ